MNFANNQKLQFILFWILLITGLPACEEDTLEESAVLTEDVLYVSGERAIFSGRFIAGTTVQLEDHGFQVDTDPNFTSPLIISLGPRDKPGAFLGETNELVNESNYFFRSFVQAGSNPSYGEPVAFNTLAPVIASFTPNFAFSGQFVDIFGGNFTQDTRVFFGAEEAVVDDIGQESSIRVRVPPIGDDFIVQISVVVQGDTLVFDDTFEYVIGKWNFEGNFVNDNIYDGAVFFTDDQDLIFGLGFENQTFHNQLWAMDLDDFSWRSLPYTGNPVVKGFAEAPFFGSGIFKLPDGINDLGNNVTDEFWEYQNGTASFAGNAPFKLINPISFSFQDDIYVLGGEFVLGGNNRVMYRYQPDLDSWEELGSANFDILRSFMHFQYEDGLYVVDLDGQMRRYDITTGSWTFVTNYPTSVNPEGIAEVIGDIAYMGLFTFGAAFWEYHIPTNTWKPKNNFTGSIFETNMAHWQHDGRVYVLRTAETTSSNSEVWSFSPTEF